jgi:hypothetical protein
MSWAALEIQFRIKLVTVRVLENLLKTKCLSIKLVMLIMVTLQVNRILEVKIWFNNVLKLRIHSMAEKVFLETLLPSFHLMHNQ